MRMKSLFAPLVRQAGAGNAVSRALALCVSALFLAGCGLFTGPEPTPTPTRQMLAAVPTFTPAPPSAPAAQQSGGAAPAQQPAPNADAPTPTPAPAVGPAPTDTPAPSVARFTVKTDLAAPAVNVRSGPSTAFPPLGTILKGAQHEITGRNVENTWYRFSFNGQQGWVYMGLLNVENAHLITLALNIPNTPVPPPPAPTATPVPVAQAPADPCANIHCFFWLRNQDFTNNGGSELKLNIGFVHQGRGDEIQGAGGSYFVELHKDGVLVSAVDHTTRGQNNTHNGPQGNKYNYLKAVPLSQVPGGNVAGNYTIFVKNGPGERVSQNHTFAVSPGNGEIWLIFAQNN